MHAYAASITLISLGALAGACGHEPLSLPCELVSTPEVPRGAVPDSNVGKPPAVPDGLAYR